jgi:hypothetical protein
MTTTSPIGERSSSEGGYHTGSSPMRPSTSPSLYPQSLAPVAEEHHHEDFNETDPLIVRICEGIDYTTSQNSSDLPIMQTTRFSIPLETSTYAPSAVEATALSLLQNSVATIISTSPSHIVYELGVPVPYFVPEGAGVRLIHTPHWWVGRSAAEVRAGPYGEEADIRKHAAKVKELATKKGKKATKTLKELEIEQKLNEGLRRQAQNLNPWDEDESEMD